jgi:hypothetical protein
VRGREREKFVLEHFIITFTSAQYEIAEVIRNGALK